jgi:thiol-disulfide isomerase/thioredoxin
MAGDRRRTLLIAGAVVAAVGAVAATVAVNYGREKRAAAELLLRDASTATRDDRLLAVARTDARLPPVTVQLPDGKPLRLADLQGRVVFLNFWATWCPPCVEEMPSMLELGRAIEDAYPDRFQMVAVSVDDGWPQVQQFFQGKLPDHVTFALDTEQVATRVAYCAGRGECSETIKFPETYILDPNGNVVAYMVGPRDWSGPAARRVIERIVRGIDPTGSRAATLRPSTALPR